jgi:protoporphyrinogen IX oxidase
MYLYLKALHIIFIVTWFSGMFYIVRLFIYNREAQDKPEPERSILQNQFSLMIKRLWIGITWPSAILTLIFGVSLWVSLPATPGWLLVKVAFVAGLYLYHFSLHSIYLQQKRGNFRHSSQRLRMWNELATVFLFAIVFIVVVKQMLSWIWGILLLLALGVLLFAAIRVYKRLRKDQ